MRFPLIHLHIDVGIESKSILLFHIISLYSTCSQIVGSLQNEMKAYHHIVNQPLGGKALLHSSN